jgi:hypothetical protein
MFASRLAPSWRVDAAVHSAGVGETMIPAGMVRLQEGSW